MARRFGKIVIKPSKANPKRLAPGPALRHTGLTWLAEEGATVRELMDASGHADVQTAMRNQHSVDTRKQTLAEKMGKSLLPDDTPEIVLARIKALDEKIATLEKQRGEEKKKLADLLG